jgi:hypothetical protein
VVAPGLDTLWRFYELGVERYGGAQRTRNATASAGSLQARGIDERDGTGGCGAAEVSAATGQRARTIDDGDAARVRVRGRRLLVGRGETQEL